MRILDALTRVLAGKTVLYTSYDGRGMVPVRAHEGDAGWDLYTSQDVRIPPNSFTDVHVDLAIALPPGVWAMITGRSSTIRKYKLRVETAIIDNGYRGEMYVGVWNHNNKSIFIRRGTRLAQVILFRLVTVRRWKKVKKLPPSSRGTGGFGSSGK